MTGQRLGHYDVIEKLGEGGMGVVYKAHDAVLNRTVAIKVLPVGKAAVEAKWQRFLQEARDRIVFALGDRTGNIWMTKLPKL